MNITLEPNGYSLDLFLSKEELNIFRTFISSQWFERIKFNYPIQASHIKENKIDISNYHKIAECINHSNLWTKSSRILNKDFFSWFQNSIFYSNLLSSFGSFEISDEENLGWPNVYWRLVRPRETADIGPIHRDSWFWQLNQSFPKPNYNFRRIKVWIAIYCEKGLNGLLVEPYSQNSTDISWKGELRHGIQKPVLLTDDAKINPILVESSPGGSIIFHDNLLHGGAVNKGSTTRVSVEFTLLVRI